MDKLAALEADVQATRESKAAGKAARKDEEARESVSRAALTMRRRRQRPDIQLAERQAIKARDAAFRLLAKAHPEEFMALVQDQRKKLGMEPLRPRGKHRTTLEQRAHAAEATPTRPAALKEQAGCQHGNYPIKKLPYGKFCGNCGKRIT